MEQDQALPLLLQPNESPHLSENETIAIRECLGNPAVRKYLRLVLTNGLEDFLTNTIEKPDDEFKLSSRFLKLQGIRYAIGFLLALPNTIKSPLKPKG